ncbi:hypothetical protein WJX73_004188 [Symbiochloris irregularis]|uniref:EF-hand domain-containing protein n=1 Tax=Symbiochloris irregularis TaxID=706552 RepID=A0AAW1PAH8_9CHLO
MASNNGRRATEVFLNLNRVINFRESYHDKRYRCVLVGAYSKYNKLLGSSVFPDDSVGLKQVLHLQGVFRRMAGAPEAQYCWPVAFTRYMSEQPVHLASLTHHLFAYIDRRRMGCFDLEDLLKAVYPSATRADCKRMAGLAGEQPVSRPLSHRRSIEQQVVNIAKAFAACDSDGSGALDLAEFTEAMGELGGYDEDQAREIFLAADTDGSGLIELAEFLTWFKAEAAKLKDGKSTGVFQKVDFVVPA